MNYTFTNAIEVVQVYGQPKTAQRKTLVKIREAEGREVFQRTEGDLVAVEGIDYVVEPVDGSPKYPCKKAIFHNSWAEISEGSGTFRRIARSKVIQVPEGDSVTLNTLEGRTNVSFPDYIALGINNEVYSHSLSWLESNLEFLD